MLSLVLVGTVEIFADCDASAKRERVAELLRELIPHFFWISEAG
jgi:predicted nucleic acid-binding protein